MSTYDYDPSSVEVLKNLEPVRKRPDRGHIDIEAQAYALAEAHIAKRNDGKSDQSSEPEFTLPPVHIP